MNILLLGHYAWQKNIMYIIFHMTLNVQSLNTF